MAGRPSKAEKYGGHVATVEGMIADRLPTLVDNLFRLADGVKVRGKDANGRKRVYTEPPDRRANEYLINRILGTPTQNIKHDFSHLTDAELVARVQGLARGDGPAGPDPGGEDG